MKIHLLLLSFLFILNGCSVPGVKINKRVCNDATVYSLDNGLIKFNIWPEYNSVISDIELLKTQKKLTPKGYMPTVHHILLPPVRRWNPSGDSTVLWGLNSARRTFILETKKTTPEGGALLRLRNSFFALRPITLYREIRLAGNEYRYTVNISVVNNGKNSCNLSIWENVVPLYTKGDVVYMPEKKLNTLLVRNIQKHYLEEKLPPARNWIGCRRGQDIIVLRSGKVFPQALYSWRSQKADQDTMEMILPAEKLLPGGKITGQFEMLFYPGLGGLNEVVGPVALRKSDNKLFFASAIALPSLTLKLDNGQIIRKNNMKPGEVTEVKLQKGTGDTLSGTLEGIGKFQLLKERN